jgi:hypothetical protein
MLTFSSGKLLLALASTVILGSESHRTHDNIFLSHYSESLATTLSLCTMLLFELQNMNLCSGEG